MHKYRRLFQGARPDWRFFIFIFALTILASTLAALQPWPLAWLTDHVLGGKPLPAPLQRVLQSFSLEPTPARLLIFIVASGLILFALNGVLEVCLTRAWTLGGRRMVCTLAEDLFARLQRRSLLFHTRNSVGDTMSRITSDSWCAYQVVETLFFTPGHALLTMLLKA